MRILLSSYILAILAGVNFSNHGIRLVAAQEGNKGEDTGQAVEPEADEKLSIFCTLLFGQRGIPKAASIVPRIKSVLVPVDIASLPRSDLLLIPGGKERNCEGCCSEGGDQSHYNKNGKGTLT